MHHKEALQEVAVAGIGGFASAHHSALRELETRQLLRVSATCDPRETSLGDLKEKLQFAEREIQIFDDFTDMLATGSPAWVALPTPLRFHASMHSACVRRGIPCYLEKPPTLDPVELERMIELDSLAIRQTQVGFAYVYQPERLRLKERLNQGEFGALLQVNVHGASRRDTAYYQRNDWAGRLTTGECLVLDSCLGNAMSHHVHNVLFFAGTSRLTAWAECRELEAVLYRANPIEGADTIFLRGKLTNSVEVRLALTHACETHSSIKETLICESAVIHIFPENHIAIEYQDRPEEIIPLARRDHLKANLQLYSEYVQGSPHQLLGTLVDCRPFVQLNALAYLSAHQIHHVSPPFSEFVPDEDYWRINQIEEFLDGFLRTGDFSLLTPLGETSRTLIPATLTNWNTLLQHVETFSALKPA